MKTVRECETDGRVISNNVYETDGRLRVNMRQMED